MDKLYKQINRVKFLMEDHKKIGDELEGIGNYLITSDYNIVNKKTLPLELLNIHDSATVSKYWDDTLEFMHFIKKELDKNKKLFSTQKYVSKTFIDSITDKVYNDSDIIVAEDKKGNYWLLNGHHRLIYDRINLKNSYAYIISFDDVKEIDDLFYTSEEEDDDE
jgi:hypothetical protein